MGKKPFAVSIGVVAVVVFVSIGCVAYLVVVAIDYLLLIGVVVIINVTFLLLQLLLLYITKYLHKYYLLRYSTYVLYITAALSLELL